MKVLVSTLRRSGSTIFWRCFREGTEALSFDEPFNPNLSQLPKRHSKNVYGEYINILDKNRRSFWDKFSPIYALEELDCSFRNEQKEWLQWLLARNEDVVLDTTRCWRKTKQLADLLGDSAYFIHLHRSPAGFATSHLLPSELSSSLLGKWDLFKRRLDFFNIDTGFNYWNLEKLTGYGPNSAYSTKVLDESVAPETFYSWSAHTRLLHFWKTAHGQIERLGKQFFEDRFFTVSYERFSREPKRTLQEIQDHTQLPIHFDNLPTVQEASPAFREGDARWYEAAEKVGIEADPQTLFRPK